MTVYLYDAEYDYELQDEELNLQEALKEFYELSDGDGSFFGIKTETKTTQFAWVADDKWLVDIPYDMEKRICLQKYADYDECVEIIKSVFSGIAPDKLIGLVKLNMMSETLDEILNRNPDFPGFYNTEKDDSVYDDYRWYITNDFPEDLPKEAALTHMGMFMGWVLDNGFEGDLIKEHFSENIEKFKQREITGAKFLEISSDSRLISQNLNDHANKFAEFYYGSNDYLNDYTDSSDDANETIFHEPDIWEKYEIVKKIIDEKYEEWTFRN